MERIIIAVPETPIGQQAITALQTARYDVSVQRNPNMLLTVIRSLPPALLILDSALISKGSLELCAKLRRQAAYTQMAILYLADVPNAQHAADILDSGADDLLRKPFSEVELVARARALIWRQQPRRTTTLTFAANSRTVWVNDRLIELTKTEFALLLRLAEAHSRPLLAEDLMKRLWADKINTDDTALVRNHIRNLRRKIEDDPDHPRYLVSHHGHGYALEVDFIRQGKEADAAT